MRWSKERDTDRQKEKRAKQEEMEFIPCNLPQNRSVTLL